MKQKTKTVYFAAAGGRLKIGSTADTSPERRVRQISIHLPEPLEVIGKVSGSIRTERAAQIYFAGHHIHREWYRDSPEARGMIAAIVADPSLLKPFEPKRESEKPHVPAGPVPPERARAARKLVLEMMWGDRWPLEIAAFAGVTPELARQWQEDEAVFPLPVKYGLSYVMMNFFQLHEVEHFYRDDSEK